MSHQKHIWSEKHRPDTLDEVIGQDEQVSQLKKWVDDESVPHLLLHGPAGTGKTSSVTAFAKDRYGDKWNQNLIDLNASDERGIDVVRDQIKSFAQQAPSGDFQYKIIYLDECDSMTKSAMNALRRTMEKYSDITRFFLSCNHPNKIIDPMQSRCVPLKFDRLEDEEVESLLVNILEDEEVDYELTAVAEIVEYVQGDARRAVQTLQTSIQDGELNSELLELVGGQVDMEAVEEMVSLAANGEFEKAQTINVTQVQPEVTDHSKFAKELMNVLLNCENINKDVRFYAISLLGEIEDNVLRGNNPSVQWNSFLARLPSVQYASIPNYES